MDTSTIIVAGIVALAVVAVGYLIARAMRRRRADLASLSTEDRALHDRCRDADKRVREEERAHRKRVAAAERALKAARNPPVLASEGLGNSVTGLAVKLNGREHPLTPEVHAHLDSTGDVTAYATSRSTLTRIAGGALVAGPPGMIVGGVAKKAVHHQVDLRELYLMVLARDWSEVVKIDPSHGESARRLMQSINVAAANCETFAVTHAETVLAAESALENARADTTALEGARALRAGLGEDPLARLRAARRQRRGDGGVAQEADAATSVPGMAVLEGGGDRGVQDDVRR